MNFGTLLSEIKSDYPEVANYWEDDDIKTKINLAQVQIAYHTLCIPHNTTLNLTGGEGNYDLNSLITNFLAISPAGGVSYYNTGNSKWDRLEPMSIAKLDEENPDWRTESDDDPDEYYMEGAELNLVPAPDSDVTDGLKVYCALSPTDMSDSSDEPFNSLSHLKPLHELIPLLVGAKMHRSKGNWSNYKKLMDIYIGDVKFALRHLRGEFNADLTPDITQLPGYLGYFKK